MKVVINAVSAKTGGAVSYITNLLRRLSSFQGEIQFVVFLPPETAGKLEGPGRNIRLLPTRIGHAGMLLRLWWDQVSLRRFLKKESADVLYSTANFAMFHCPVRQLLLVRNALYFSRIYRETFLPENFLRRRLDFALRRRFICWSAAWADVVMTPTRTMFEELRQFAHTSRQKALVNFYGVPRGDPLRYKRKDDAVARNSSFARTTRLLYVSCYYEHKNLTILLKAMPALNRSGKKNFVLKTTADPEWRGFGWTRTHKLDARLTKDPAISACVEIIGLQDREKTARLYAEADIFVFPSLTESFGFPMAEAMSFGLPIVAADTPVNREICEGAALYFDPLDARDLAQKIQQLAADQELRNLLGKEGVRRAQTYFDWSAHVRRLIDALSTSGSQADLLNGGLCQSAASLEPAQPAWPPPEFGAEPSPD